MPKTVAQNVLQQLRRIGEDSFEGGKQAVSDTAGKALESLGVGASSGQQAPFPPPTADQEKQKIEQLKAADKIRTEQLASSLKKDLEVEIEKWRRIREEQLRQRRQLLVQAQAKVEKSPLEPLEEPTTARRKGIFGALMPRRIKSAQAQAQPETVGRRVSG